MGWDVFISHASEDKADVARPLADALKALGIKVWLDEWELKVGDSLRHKIDEGLADSRFGVVILSRNFFSKIWTKSELDALFCRDDNGQKVLLPVWHGVTKAEVTKFSPILAGLLAANFDEGIDVTVRKIIQGMGKNETNCLSSTEQNLKTWLSGRLIDTFNKDGIYQGHFGGCESWKEAQRWQLEKGGEVVDSPLAPKLPYFGTYWAYEAAFRLLPEKIACWTPVTRAAISRHFGSKRWLKVVREYSFHDGPLCVPKMYESIRHTARAAEVLHLLNPSDSEVSRIAWDLLDEAPLLQQEDGGWPEFRTCSQEASLWSTVYVYRFLSKLIAPDHPTPDEHHSFLKHVLPLLARMTEFLGEQWRRSNWTPNDKISWEEGAASVLAEIAPFCGDKELITAVYSALRETVTPAGRLKNVQNLSAPNEYVRALRLAFALKAAGRRLCEGDSRYKHLVEWLAKNVNDRVLEPHDVAFATFVLLELPMPSNSDT